MGVLPATFERHRHQCGCVKIVKIETCPQGALDMSRSTEAPVTDSDRNHGFGSQHPQGNGGQPQPSRKETHPDTVDFEAPPTQERPVHPRAFPQEGERNYSNPFAQSGAQGNYAQQQFPTQQFPPQSAAQGGGQYEQQPFAYSTAYSESAPAHRGSGNGGKYVLIAVLILAVLLVIAALAYLIFFKNSGTGTQADAPLTTAAQLTEDNDDTQETVSAADEAEKTTEETTTSSASQKRPEHPDLPAGAIPANDAARNNEPGGNFNSVYRGTEVTSEPFANAVRDEYVKHWVDTHEYDATIEAYSPSTKQNYTMDCSDNGEFVTCKGGNNAVVYIL